MIISNRLVDECCAGDCGAVERAGVVQPDTTANDRHHLVRSTSARPTDDPSIPARTVAIAMSQCELGTMILW
jgi:hypothetical protein